MADAVGRELELEPTAASWPTASNGHDHLTDNQANPFQLIPALVGASSSRSMSTSPILPLRPLSPEHKKSAHAHHLQRRLSTPSSQPPSSRTASPSYGAPSSWEDHIPVPSSQRRRKKSAWQTYRQAGSFAVVALFLVGILGVSLLSDSDGEGSALKRWWNHEGRKGTHQTCEWDP